MALNATQLGTLIDSKIQTLSETDKRDSLKVWTEVAKAIVEHITQNAEVTTTVSTVVTIPITSAPPAPSSGSGLGTGNGVIS